MEDENILKTEKQSPLSPVIAMLGVGLAIVAIALGIVSMIKVGDTAKDMNAKIEKAAAVALETKKISDRIDSLAMQLEDIKANEKTRSNSLVEQLNAELTRLREAIADTRKVADENRTAIETVAKRSVRAHQKQEQPKEAAASSASPAEKPASDAPAQAQDGAKKHVIQSGDTFAKLAKKYGVSVSAIVSANPDANPSKLKVGQEIVIP